jgi:putative flippase GtrA
MVQRLLGGTDASTLVRFLAVGLVTAVIYFGVFSLVGLVAGDFVAVSAAYVVAVTFHYLTNRSFTFGFRDVGDSARRAELLRYLGTLAVSYAVNVAVYWLAAPVLGAPELLALLAALGSNTVVAFILMHNWVFRSAA